MTWSGVPYAASYLVSVATEPTLSSLVLHDTGSTAAVSTAATSLTSPAMLAPGSYFWSVTPVDARGNKGAASAGRVVLVGLALGDDADGAGRRGGPGGLRPAVLVDTRRRRGALRGRGQHDPDFATGSKVCCTRQHDRHDGVPDHPAQGQHVLLARPGDRRGRERGRLEHRPDVHQVLRQGAAGDRAQHQERAHGRYRRAPRRPPAPRTRRACRSSAGTPCRERRATRSTSPTAATGPGPSPHRWSVVTATTAWTPLGHSWNNQKPHPDAHAMAYDRAFLEAGLLLRARARPLGP